MQNTAEGARLRDAGMDAATHAARERLAELDLLIARAAATGREFSANDIRAHLPEGIRTASVGARFAHWSRRGLIQAIGYTTSTDPGTHAHPVRTWRGTR